MRVFVCLCLSLLLVACIDEEQEAVSSVAPGDRLPSFAVIDERGEEVTEASFVGTVSMLVLFNTTCPDCQRDLPVIQALYEAYGGDGRVRFFCISREEPYDSVRDYWDANGLSLPFSAQDDRAVYELFTNEGIPFVVISDGQGIIRYTYTYVAMPPYEQLASDLESLL